MKFTHGNCKFTGSAIRSASFLIVLVCGGIGLAQENKQFSSEGTSFKYPTEWVLEDTSSADVQQISLYDKSDDAIVQIIVLKKRTESKTAMADLKKQVIDPWIEKLVNQYTTEGVSIHREPATDKIGEADAEGIKFKFVLDNQQGGGQAFWSLIDKRLVLLYFVRPDKTADKATAGWDALRKSLTTAGEKK
jgi:hypothetical protein